MAEIVELEICYICDDSFQDLEEHFYDKHASWKIFKCDICNENYNSDNELQKHKTEIHTLSSDIKENVKDCQNMKFSLEDQTCKVITEINKKEQKEDTIENQVITINDSSPKKRLLQIKGHIVHDHRCESCSKSFYSEGILKRHIHTIHEGHKGYKCKSCGKSFVDGSNLKRHIHTVHEGHKDHKCESCGKSFSEKANLKKHIHTVHEGHQDYKCESCGKSFSQAGNLKKHIYMVHEEHRDHKCEFCAKLFSQAGDLKKHVHTIHQGYKNVNLVVNPFLDH